jgi:hypothetical protein
MSRWKWIGAIAWACALPAGVVAGCGSGTAGSNEPVSGGSSGSSTSGSGGSSGGPSGSGGGSSSATSSGNSSGGSSGTAVDNGGGDDASAGSPTNHGGGTADGGKPSTSGGGGSTNGCGETLPALSDYTQNGPFSTTTINNTGPDGGYTVVQPMPLGMNGFKHPVAMWGNGITTTPALYPTLLNRIASNGIVVVASNSTSVMPSDMTGGLDWMVAQNGSSGAYKDMLDTKCLISIGYSLGGGGAVTAGSHPDVVTTVSFHGVQGNSAALKTPLLLFTSTTDTFVVPATFVTPTYNASVVQTFYATLTDAGDPSNAGHLLPVSATDPEYAPALAWLRLWVYGDQGGKHYFYGSSATLCQAPWTCESKEPGGMSQMSGF